MKCLIYCPDKILRGHWDYYLRQQVNTIFYFSSTFPDIDIQFDRVIFCQENKNLHRDAKEKGIYTLFTGEEKELQFQYDAVYFWQDLKKIIDQIFESKKIPREFMSSTMDKIIPFLFQVLKNKKSGVHFLTDEEPYKNETVCNFYQQKAEILPEEMSRQNPEKLKGVRSFKRAEKVKINIYLPTYYRFEKTKKSLLTIIETSQKSKHDIQVYIGDNNTKLEEMKNWLKALPHAKVYFHSENIGKAMMINLLHKNARDCDYIFSIDSDMVVESQPQHPFEHMIDCLEFCDNVGLVSSNQKDCNQHWFNRGVVKAKERGFNIGYAPDCVGVAGGCVVMRSKDWDKLGGYKNNHDIYTGDDGILTYNITRKLGKRVLVDVDAYLLHPRPGEDEKGYTEWKMKSWQRDGLNFIKDSYTGENKKGYFD